MLSVNMLVDLLSHAEVLEDVVEGLLRGDLATCDFGKEVDGLAEIFRQEIAT